MRFSAGFLYAIAAILLLWSCHEEFKGTTIDGYIQNADNHTIVMEDIATPQKVIVDSAVVEDGKIKFQIYINKGIYRLRDTKNDEMIFIYIDQSKNNMYLKWDVQNTSQYFVEGSLESQQLMNLVAFEKINSKAYVQMDSLGARDSLSVEKVEELKSANQTKMMDFIQSFIDSVQNPDVAAFALNYVGAAPENINYLIKTSEQLHTKDPNARYAEAWFQSMDGYRTQLLNQVENGLKVGSPAPDFSAITLQNDTVQLKKLRGNYVLIDFWASWCQPCRKENPNLVQAYKLYANRKFTIISISLDSKLEQVEKGIQQDHLSWTYHICDFAKWRSPLVKLYDVKGIPASFLVDQNGEIIARDLKGEALISTLDKMLPPEMIEITDSLGRVTLVPKYPENQKDSTGNL